MSLELAKINCPYCGTPLLYGYLTNVHLIIDQVLCSKANTYYSASPDHDPHPCGSDFIVRLKSGKYIDIFEYARGDVIE